MRAAFSVVFQLDHLQQVLGFRFDLRVRWTFGLGLHGQAEGDVLQHGHVPEQSVMLEYEADPALLGRTVRRVLAAQGDGAAVGHFQTGDDAQQGGLA